MQLNTNKKLDPDHKRASSTMYKNMNIPQVKWIYFPGEHTLECKYVGTVCNRVAILTKV